VPTRNLALVYIRKSLITRGTTAASPEIQLEAGKGRAADLGLKAEVFQDIDGHKLRYFPHPWAKAWAK